MGLREHIAKSSTVAEVKLWLAEGCKYEKASLRTKRSWINTADRRIKELQKVQPK